MRFDFRWLGFCPLVVALMAGPAAAETVLRGRLNADILAMDPAGVRDGNTDAIQAHLFEGLVAFREDGSVGPLLANGWTVSADGKTYTFALRQSVVFHNGDRLTSADVVWSLKRYLGAGKKWRCGSDLGPGGVAAIKTISAPDDFTVKVELDHAAPMFLKTLARPDCGGTGIMSPASVGPDGAWLKPVGTGPFMLKTWKRNQYIDLLRFPQYASLPGPRDGLTGGKQVGVDRVRILIIPDSTAALGAVLSGGIDVLDEVSSQDQETVRMSKSVTLGQSPVMDTYTILMQTRDPLLSDVRLRRAIAMSIDSVGLARTVTHGTALANRSPVPRSSAFFGPVEARMPPADLAEARRLVKASGYKGQPITIVTNHRYPEHFDSAVIVHAMARQIGLNVHIETVDWATEVERYSTGNYQLMAFAFSARLDPSLNFGLFVGDKQSDPRKVWDSPAARTLLREATEAADTVARQKAFDALHEAFVADTPAIVLYNSTRVYAVRKNVTGYKAWVADIPRFWGVGFK